MTTLLVILYLVGGLVTVLWTYRYITETLNLPFEALDSLMHIAFVVSWPVVVVAALVVDRQRFWRTPIFGPRR